MNELSLFNFLQTTFCRFAVNAGSGTQVSAIIEKYLGKGKKVADATPEQAEFIYLINSEIKDELK